MHFQTFSSWLPGIHTMEKDHGRIESRDSYAATDLSWLFGTGAMVWPEGAGHDSIKVYFPRRGIGRMSRLSHFIDGCASAYFAQNADFGKRVSLLKRRCRACLVPDTWFLSMILKCCCPALPEAGLAFCTTDLYNKVT